MAKKTKIRFEYDEKEKTVYHSSTLYFLRGQFANGYLLGFWSHSPCCGVCNTEKGWAVIDPQKRIIIEDYPTRTYGLSTGENYQGFTWREWMAYQRELYGKISYFRNESGGFVWKMED